MFERFTDRARRVIVLAQEEARLLDHHHIGTEHVLLGMVHEGEGIGASLLRDLGVSLESLRDGVVERVERASRPPSGHIPFTLNAKRTLEMSLKEALQLGHNYIGTEHILLGLMGREGSTAHDLLVERGVTHQVVRERLMSLLVGDPPQGATEDSEPQRRAVPPEAVAEYPRLRRLLAGPEHDRIFAKSGSPYEARYGFSRGIRVGDRVEVAGTAPIPAPGDEVSPDAYGQMMRCGAIAIEALAELGASAADVVRTVMYITDPAYSDEVGRAHKELFGDAAPVATMVVVAALLDPAWKVEIEVSAQL